MAYAVTIKHMIRYGFGSTWLNWCTIFDAGKPASKVC